MIKKFIVTIILILSILFSGLNLTMVEAKETTDVNKEITILDSMYSKTKNFTFTNSDIKITNETIVTLEGTVNTVTYGDIFNAADGKYVFRIENTNGIYRRMSWWNDKVSNVKANAKLVIKQNGRYTTVSLDDETKKSSMSTDIPFTGTGFKLNMNLISLKELKIEDKNGVLIKDYVPALDKEGKPCIYDKVNNSCNYFKDTSSLVCNKKENDTTNKENDSNNKEVTVLNSMYSKTKNFTFTNSDIKITNETIVTLEGTVNTVTYGDIFNAASGKYVFRMENTNGIYRRMSWWNDKVSNVKANAKLVIKQNGRYTTVSLNDETKKSSMSTDIPFSGTGFKLNMNLISLKELKIEDKNGVLIKDYVPALDKEGKPCIYDKINNSCQYFKDTSSLVYDKPEIKVIDFKDIDFKDISNWRSGVYHYSNGEYCEYDTRICLNDYVKVTGGEYKVIVKNSDYRLLIRELDKDRKFIETYTLSNGQTYKPSNNTCYLAISIYNAKSEDGITYNTYKQLFEKGFYAGLEKIETEEGNTSNISNMTENETKVYQLLKNTFLSASKNKVDISKYKIKQDKLEELWNKVIDEYYIEYIAQPNLQLIYNYTGDYATYYYTLNADSTYKTRTPKIQATINEVTSQVDSKMTDLDKVLLAHEYLVDHTEYKSLKGAGYSQGPLYYGYGICAGYASAMRDLLRFMDVETEWVGSPKMNHGWLAVKLDGEWYHIDPTWDDTQSGDNGEYKHRFLIRNDKEFLTIKGARAHYSWGFGKRDDIKVECNSTKYVNWYVHNVVGDMYYHDGLWYYVDSKTNSLMASDITGKVNKVIVDGTSVSGKMKIKGIVGNMVKYKVGNTEYTISI